jgi:hypothetical protein
MQVYPMDFKKARADQKVKDDGKLALLASTKVLALLVQKYKY